MQPSQDMHMQTNNNKVVYRVISLKPTLMKNHGQGNPEFYVYTHTHTHTYKHTCTLLDMWFLQLNFF